MSCSPFGFFLFPVIDLTYHPRLSHPYKVLTIQQRHAVYGGRVEIRPVDDPIRGDLTGALEGTCQINERNTASVLWLSRY